MKPSVGAMSCLAFYVGEPDEREPLHELPLPMVLAITHLLNHTCIQQHRISQILRSTHNSSPHQMHVLSIPTWIIHISSVIEWMTAIWLIWLYAEASGNLAWRSLSLGMLPALVSAMCACTWHFFDNPADLEWLVTLQAAMTVVGNITMCLAGWKISGQFPNP